MVREGGRLIKWWWLNNGDGGYIKRILWWFILNMFIFCLYVKIMILFRYDL